MLHRYYEHAYVAPGERFPRRAETRDALERDVRTAPHSAPGSELATVGDIFSDETNPGRKQAFDIRSVMKAVVDSDHRPLERWERMRDAEAAVVWDAHLGGWPTTVIGIESHPIDRFGPTPADGPSQWTSGTLFPKSSKKVARAINSNGGRRPLVVLANLAGFDGSPESMRQWQLEYGAEIGRAIVNFRGPIVFCVISRYHGGAFVVFSQRLNEGFETIAVEGAKASVIGGSAAAGVVFTRDVTAATRGDARVVEMEERIEAAEDAAVARRLRAELDLAAGHRPRREDGRAGGQVRLDPLDPARGRGRLGLLDRRRRRPAPLPDRRDRARHGQDRGRAPRSSPRRRIRSGSNRWRRPVPMPEALGMELMRLHRIDHVSLDVADRPRSIAWYEDVLGARAARRSCPPEEPIFIGPVGAGWACSPSARPACATSRWPPTCDGQDGVVERLERLAIPYRRERHSDHHSVYFADPDGNTLEVMVARP